MAVKLYRCTNVWLKAPLHPCWRVHKALEEQGIDYELVTGPFIRSKRDHVERVSGQRLYPVIQFEDGTSYREDSKDMAARIRAGKLFEERQGDQGSPAVSQPTST